MTGSVPGARHAYDRSTHLSPSHAPITEGEPADTDPVVQLVKIDRSGEHQKTDGDQLNSQLLSRWIGREGAKRIAVEAGIVEHGAWGVDVEEYRSHGEHEVMKCALRSARQLERLLESL